ncbi:hypothetical protein EDEG_03378 [Edhazardia aedis USNM 41457]|uniref:Uncharacterized protein n=1 Tax=Edhazardia aedis (strain USNM 41457) TaxID=1003232 RepID=J9DLE7_EDHAE|nr:hypothetical protein EDEG_03378 [Edhazardia aedis USNM 41457]|eukprot:EJW02182.1 hypothetical protein EDEG_03378 [Edhazardia aedis USNM 41457]
MHPGRNNKGHNCHVGRQHSLRSRISDSNKTNNYHSLSSSYYNLLTNSIYESYLLNPNDFLNSRNMFSLYLKHSLLNNNILVLFLRFIDALISSIIAYFLDFHYNKKCQ